MYKIIQELGGSATTKEIRNLAYSKYPNRSLYTYVTNRLIKLEKDGYITKITNEKTNNTWKITNKEYPR